MLADPKTDLDQLSATAPPEIWALWSEEWGWIQAEDKAGNPKLWFESEDEADEGAAHHSETYGIDCTPIDLIELRRRMR